MDRNAPEPGPDWLTLEQAPFFFWPRPLLTGDDLHNEMVLRLKWLTRSNGFDCKFARDGEFSTSVQFAGLEFTIDAEHQTFCVRRAGIYEDFEWDGGVVCSPISFPTWPHIYAEGEWKKPMLEVARVASCMSAHMARNFDDALNRGFARIMARPATPLAPHTRILPDQWGYFSVLGDGDTAIAKGPNGEHLYSIRIAPFFDGQPPAVLPPVASAENECRRWLSALMAMSPNRSTATRGELQVRAQADFPGLSARGFARAWAAAVRTTGAQEWSRPGRPIKTSREKSLRQNNRD